MKLTPYQYVVLYHPKDANTYVVKHKDIFLGANERAAEIDALTNLPNNLDVNLVEVIVRPFRCSTHTTGYATTYITSADNKFKIT